MAPRCRRRHQISAYWLAHPSRRMRDNVLRVTRDMAFLDLAKAQDRVFAGSGVSVGKHGVAV